MNLRDRLRAVEKAVARVRNSGSCATCGRNGGCGRGVYSDHQPGGYCAACDLTVNHRGEAIGTVCVGGVMRIKRYGFPEPVEASA